MRTFKMLGLIILAAIFQLPTVSMAGPIVESFEGSDGVVKELQAQRIERLCQLSSEGADRFFRKILDETNIALKWVGVVEAMPKEIRLAFARELVGQRTSFNWVKEWTKARLDAEKSGSVDPRQLALALQAAKNVWNKVEASFAGGNSAEVKAWRNAVQHDEPDMTDSFGSLHNGFIQKTINIAATCVASLSEEELNGLIFDWRSHTLISGLSVIAGSLGLWAATDWGFALIAFLFGGQVGNLLIRDSLTDHAFKNIFQATQQWRTNIDAAGGQLADVNSYSLHRLVSRIGTEGISAVSKIDIARAGFAELWQLKQEVQEFRANQHGAGADARALQIARRLRQYHLDSLQAALHLASVGLYSLETEGWSKLILTLAQRVKTSNELFDSFLEEFYSPSMRKDVLKELDELVKKREWPIALVGHIGRPIALDLSSGVGIKGMLTQARASESGKPAYLHFTGPTALLDGKDAIAGQGTAQHPDGFGTPVGLLKDGSALEKCLAEDLKRKGIKVGKREKLEFASGVVVDGVVAGFTWSPKDGRLLLITFQDCDVTLNGKVLFDHSWGVYDMAVGSRVKTVSDL